MKKQVVIIKYSIYILCLILAVISVLCTANMNIGYAIAFVLVCLGNIVLYADTKENNNN